MAPATREPRRTVLITGCSADGIGSALVEAFHAKGLHVFATARSLSKMSHLQELTNITLLELDVVSSASIDTVMKTVTEMTGGKLDYLVNNAGLALMQPALDTGLERARNIFEVNFWGTANMIHAFAPLLIASKGTIVNISSGAAVAPLVWGSYYNASKAAVRQYGETLRLELAPLGVKVVTVMVGFVGTKIMDNLPDFELPDDSLWKPASKAIKSSISREGAPEATPPSVLARDVVNDVLGGANGLTWRGRQAGLARLASAIFPSWLIDRIIVSGSGLDLIK